MVQCVERVFIYNSWKGLFQFICPTFLWLRLKVSILWTCSNSASSSQILSPHYVWTLRGTKRYLVLSSPPLSCSIMTSHNLSGTKSFSRNLRIAFHLKVTAFCYYLHTKQLIKCWTDVSQSGFHVSWLAQLILVEHQFDVDRIRTFCLPYI